MSKKQYSYEYRKANGLCVVCGKPNDRDNRVSCTECADMQKQLMRYRREQLHKRGMCIGCGGNKVDKSFKYCEKCREREATKMVTKKRKHKQAYTCYVCGERKLHIKTNGKKATYCSTCREKILKQQKEIRSKKFKEELQCK